MWINIEESHVEDETISNAFSSRGVYRISTDDEVQQMPRVQAGVYSGKTFINIDSTLFLLEDEPFKKCNILTFEVKVDCLVTSFSGAVLLCGLNNGELHGISIVGKLLFRCSINEKDINIIGGPTFVIIQQLNNIIYLVCSNGSTYMLSDFDDTMWQSFNSQDNASNNASEHCDISTSKINVKRSFVIKTSQIILTALFIANGCEEEPDLIAGTSSFLYQRKYDNHIIRINVPDVYRGIKQIYHIENEILLLTHSGHLLTYCPTTSMLMLSITVPKGLIEVQDLLVTDCNSEHIEILVLTKQAVNGGIKQERGKQERDDNCSLYLNVVEYPALKIINELELSDKPVWLVEQPKSSVNLYYIIGMEFNSNDLPTVLELTVISETDPSDRFKKLIIKGRLNEAEHYGKQFGLCLQPINEARAKRLLIEISSLSSFREDYDIVIQERFASLINIIKKIDNRDFFKAIRSFSLPSRQILQNYLEEIIKHLDAKLDAEVILEIREELDRLETLTIIDPYEIDIDWMKFVHHKNLIKYLMQLLKTNMLMACLIWSRHSSSILRHLSDMDVRLLLTAIPDDMRHFHLLQWLRQFMPIVSNTHPMVMPFVMEWSRQKVYLLQHSQLWPEVGLEFCTGLMDTFGGIHFLYTDVRRQWDRNICELRNLLNAMQDLCVLKKSYNLIFTLNNYLQESIDETAKCMLLGVHLDNLKSLVNDFLYPIYQEKGLSPVTAIKCYIKLLVACRKTFNSWLERSVHCIELLYNEDDRLELALLVLQNTPVPWPEVAEPLIMLRYSTHSIGQKIKNEYEKQVIKILKVKYNWPIDGVSSSSSVADSDVQLLMLRIVKMSLPEMLDDIHVLTKAVPEVANAANFNVCYQLVQRGQTCRAFEFFQKLKHEQNGQYAKNIIDMFANLLESPSITLDEQSGNEQQEQRQIKFYCLLTTTMIGRSDNVHKRRLNMIENHFTLKHYYRIPIKDVDELYVNSNCIKFLELGITHTLKCLPSDQNGSYIVKYLMKELKRLSKALNLNHILVLKCLCERTNYLPLSCVLVHKILDAYNCNSGNKNNYIELALVLISQQIMFIKAAANDSDATGQGIFNNQFSDLNNYWAFPLAYRLLTEAVLYANNETIDIIELMNFIRLIENCTPYQNHQQFELHMAECEKRIPNYVEFLMKQFNDNDRMNENEKIGRNKDVPPFLNNSQKMEQKKNERVSISIFDQIDVIPEEITASPPSSASTTLVTSATPIHINYNEYLRNVRFVANTLLLVITLPQHKTKNSLLKKLHEMVINESNLSMKLDFEQICQKYFTSLKYLIKSKKHNIWYITTQYIIDYQQRHKYSHHLVDLRQFITSHMATMLRNALNHKNVNFLDLFNMLIENGYAANDLKKLSPELKTDLQKIHFLTLEEMHSRYDEQFAMLETIRLKRLKHFYYGEFCKLDPNIRGKFNPEIDAVELLIKHSDNKLLDVKLLERMSRDFTLNYQNLLVSQVICVLQGFEMNYEITTSLCDDEELNMITTVESIREQCQPYLIEIKNIDLLTSTLKRFIEQIHIYFYEMYLCVIEILEYFEAVPKEMQLWKSILHFLKYKMINRRRNRAEQWETDLWLESQNEVGVLPKIARYRLPFKPVVELPLKDVLNGELNVANCESWFPLIQMHTLLKGSQDLIQNCDYFCMVAVKNCIAEYKNQSGADSWHKQPTNNAFLKSVLRLVKHIQSENKVFLTLYFVSNYAPEGADQVEASYECYKYLMENEKAIVTDAKCVEQADKIKRKYPNLKTQHLLRIYGLNDEKLLTLIEQPKELIYQLYHHEIILNNGKLALTTTTMDDNNGASYIYVNINILAQEIAELHHINLEALQITLLQQWLSFTINESALTANGDDSVLDQTATILEENQDLGSSKGVRDLASENVIRANYIINTWPMETAVHFLIAQIFPANSSESIEKQLQMYECYFKLYDGRSNLNNTLLNQQQYMNIKCVHDLKQLGYNINLQKFKASSKIDILKDIWQQRLNSNTNPLMLKILANICLGFHIHIDKIWNGILKLMVKHQMYEDLNALVDVLSCQAQLKHIEGLILAWECVLLQPFKLAIQQRLQQQEQPAKCLTPSLDDLLNRTLIRIQCCPIIHSLDLIKFIEHCLNLNRCDMAAIFLSFCKTLEQRQEVKHLINPLKNEKMRQQILDFESIGITPLIVNFILNELNL